MFTNMSRTEMETTEMCSQHVEYCAHCTQCYSNKCCFQLDMLLCIRYRNVYDVDNNTSGGEDGSQLMG